MPDTLTPNPIVPPDDPSWSADDCSCISRFSLRWHRMHCRHYRRGDCDCAANLRGTDFHDHNCPQYVAPSGDVECEQCGYDFPARGWESSSGEFMLDGRWFASRDRDICDACLLSRFCSDCDCECMDCRCEFDGCRSCECGIRDDDDAAHLHDYGFKPCPNFYGAGPLHLGIELEVGSDYELPETIYGGVGRQDELLYCKSDSSVEGVEIVSHPMSFAWFNENFPFRMFRPYSPESQHGISRHQPAGHGIHVHVSRSGFKSTSHVYKWLLLWYRNEPAITSLARRDPSHWGSFYKPSADHVVCKAVGHDKHGYRYSGDRYEAINANNADTFEVRVFRSTWDETEFRAAVELVHASVIYAEHLDSNKVLKGHGLDFQSFANWVARRPEYGHLLSEIERLELANITRVNGDQMTLIPA